MKHCPNPECGGRKKFGLISEFNDTATVCSDCGGELAAGEAPDRLPYDGPPPEPDMKLVPVLRVVHEMDVALAESLLGDAQIGYLARGKQIQDLFGMGRLVTVNPVTEPVEFLVAEKDAATAREILADFLNAEAGESD